MVYPPWRAASGILAAAPLGVKGATPKPESKTTNIEPVFVPALRFGGDYAGLAQGTRNRRRMK